MNEATSRRSARARLLAALVAGAVLGGSAGCEDKPKTEASADAGASDGGAKGPVLDSRLQSAVAAAATGSAGAAPNVAGPNAPPESGVFGPGQADKAHAKGAPSTLELLNEGNAPRAQLATAVDGAEHKTTLSVSVHMGPQQAMPTIDYALVWKAEGAKDKPKDQKDQGVAGETRVIAKIAAATLPATQPGAIPKELSGELAKMKGSVIQLAVSKNGAVGQVKAELSKDARPELSSFLDALVDAVGTLWMPVPDKPIGAGAYWMTTDRASALGIDVVRYRVFHVEKIDGDNVTLSMDTRQYAADEHALSGGPAGAGNMALEMFESQGKGDTAVTAKNPFMPVKAAVSQRVQARLKAGGNQRKMLQVDLTAAIGGPAAAPPPP